LKYLPLVLVSACVGLVILAAGRLSAEGLAVVVGMAVGVAASAPIAFLLVALLRREHAEGAVNRAPQPPLSMILIDTDAVRGEGDWPEPLYDTRDGAGSVRIRTRYDA